MKHKETAMCCKTYIEQHIKEDLTAEIIAQAMGYSMYHLLRIFKSEMGMPLMEYGYETHGGFTKAFKSKFGFTPNLIHAMCMTYELLDEKGGRYMGDKVFMNQSVDFKEEGELYKELIEKINEKGITQNLNSIEKAYKMAQQIHQGEKRRSGEDYIIHPLNVALILVEMEGSENSIIGGLLHEVCEKESIITLKQVKKDFSPEVENLVREVGLLKNESLLQLEKLPEDVVLIKLADRLHNMRTIKYMPPEQFKEKAKETIEIFSPVAAKLGSTKLKMELDDLALKYL